MTTYLDTQENPALLISFGYSYTTDATNKVLAVRGGRVVLFFCTPEQFKAEYIESNIPHSIAVQTLAGIARDCGCDLNARRTLLWFRNAPAWKIGIVDLMLRISRRL